MMEPKTDLQRGALLMRKMFGVLRLHSPAAVAAIAARVNVTLLMDRIKVQRAAKILRAARWLRRGCAPANELYGYRVRR